MAGETPRRAFRIPNDEWEAFVAMAESKGKSASEIVRQLMKEYVEDLARNRFLTLKLENEPRQIRINASAIVSYVQTATSTSTTITTAASDYRVLETPKQLDELLA